DPSSPSFRLRIAPVFAELRRDKSTRQAGRHPPSPGYGGQGGYAGQASNEWNKMDSLAPARSALAGLHPAMRDKSFSPLPKRLKSQAVQVTRGKTYGRSVEPMK